MRCANQCLRRSRVSEERKVLGSVSGKACDAWSFSTHTVYDCGRGFAWRSDYDCSSLRTKVCDKCGQDMEMRLLGGSNSDRN